MFFRRRVPDPPPAPSAPAPLSRYQEVTVLFADLEGFTALAERLPAHDVVARLNEYLAAMSRVVVAHGGLIDKYIGDAMLVVWDAPEPAAGARAAVRAALAMQDRLTDLQERWLAEGKHPLKHRIGIATGQAIIGLIGAPERQERTVIGDAVNTAARLEAHNKATFTDVLIAARTRELVGEAAVVRALGPVRLKGRTAPVDAFALLGWHEA